MSFRHLFAVALFVLLLFLAFGVAASGEADATLRITISPVNGDPGTEIAVTGEGARSGIPVKVMIVTNGDTGEGFIAEVEVDPAEDGAFSTNIAVPEGTADGSYAVRAEQRSDGGSLIHYWWVGFQVGGSAALLPVTGTLPGTTVTITAALAALLVGGLLFQGTCRIFRR
jgi:hypothetical protein